MKRIFISIITCILCLNIYTGVVFSVNNESIEKKDKVNENAVQNEKAAKDGDSSSNNEKLKQNDASTKVVSQEKVKNETPIKKERTIKDGYYYISTSLNEKMVLDISKASKNNFANVQIWENVGEKQQKFHITYNGDGYYTIKNVLSKKVLDVANGVGKSGTNVWQYEANKSNPQKWIIKESEDGYYYIISALNNLYLNVDGAKIKSGTNIQVLSKNETKAQKFKFVETEVVEAKKTIENGYYTISTKLNEKKVLDVSQASTLNFANIQIWDNVDEKQQKFHITYNGDGYYTIKNVLSNRVLDVANGAGRSGSNVWQYEKNGSNAQKWIITKNADGYYSIISALNDELSLDVANGSTKNGANIQIYKTNKTDAQKFKMTKTEVIEPKKTISNGIYKIAMLSKRNMVLDIDGASVYNCANVQTWTYENVLQQKFLVTYNNDGYYTIKSIKSGRALDVKNGSGQNGANVWQYEYNGSKAQKWAIIDLGWGIYNIVSACNDKYLTIANENAQCGTNVEINKKNANNAQKFVFEKVTAIQCETGTYGSSGLKIKGDSRGQSLRYYKIGHGPNVFFGTFAVHGWEDNFSYDGQELTKIAENFKNKLVDMQDEAIANKWTIYLFPSVNPDGEYHGYSHNGPGRTTLYSAAPKNKGIDINRGWSTGYARATNDRNYNGTEPLQAYEARALRDFLLNHKSKNGQTVLVDLHGWLNETLGDNGIGSYYRNTLGMSKHISSYGKGYLINWAKSNLGSNGRAARSALIELPNAKSSNQVSSWGLSDKYINATINMLRGI